jgi:pimeloyl-ACP methyl ester carboxylesterase
MVCANLETGDSKENSMADNAIRSRFVMAGGVRTHYSEAGKDGPAVVLLHGGGAGSSGEAGFGSVMPILGEKLQVYALDSVGGYGETDPEAPTAYGVQSRLKHLEDFIDALCLDDICLAGNSQGAWVAARYAILHPDKIRKLCLVASSTIASAMGMKVPQTEGMTVMGSYDGTREAMVRLLQTLILDQSKITDDLVDRRQAAASRPGAPESRARFQVGNRFYTTDPGMRQNYDMRHTLPALPVPSIFVWGENDAFAPPEVGRELENMLPNIPFHWIADANHQAQNDQPEVVGKIMTDFFTSA